MHDAFSEIFVSVLLVVNCSRHCGYWTVMEKRDGCTAPRSPLYLKYVSVIGDDEQDAPASLSAEERKQPNLIWIMADDLGYTKEVRRADRGRGADHPVG